MKLFYLLILLISIVFGCSKEQKTINKLEGTWEIVSYKKMYVNGLSETIESTGEFIFSDYKINSVAKGTFSHSQNFQTNTVPSVISETGNYSIINEGKGVTLQKQKPDGSFDSDLKLDINIITTTDLILVGVIDNINQTFVLKKKL